MAEDIQGSTATIETKPVSTGSMLVSIFTEPSKVFRSIKEKPNWLVPLVLFLVIIMVGTYLMMPIIQKTQLDLLEQSDKYTPEQKEQYRQAYASSGAFAMIGVITAPIFFVIVMFLGVGMIMLMGNVVFGGKAGFAQVFAMLAWSFMTWVVGSLVKTPLILAKGTLDIRTSLAIVLPGDTMTGPLYSFLNTYTDIFVIWQLILLIIGVKIIYDFATSKASMTVLIPTAVLAVISTAVSAITT